MGLQWCPGYFYGSWIAIFDTSNCWFLFLCHKPLLMSMPPPNHTEWEQRFTQIFLYPPKYRLHPLRRRHCQEHRPAPEGVIVCAWLCASRIRHAFRPMREAHMASRRPLCASTYAGIFDFCPRLLSSLHRVKFPPNGSPLRACLHKTQTNGGYMNNIPEFMGGGEYNSSNFQLVDCPIKCHSRINRRSLQSEGGAR